MICSLNGIVLRDYEIRTLEAEANFEGGSRHKEMCRIAAESLRAYDFEVGRVSIRLRVSSKRNRAILPDFTGYRDDVDDFLHIEIEKSSKGPLAAVKKELAYRSALQPVVWFCFDENDHRRLSEAGAVSIPVLYRGEGAFYQRFDLIDRYVTLYSGESVIQALGPVVSAWQEDCWHEFRRDHARRQLAEIQWRDPAWYQQQKRSMAAGFAS